MIRSRTKYLLFSAIGVVGGIAAYSSAGDPHLIPQAKPSLQIPMSVPLVVAFADREKTPIPQSVDSAKQEPTKAESGKSEIKPEIKPEIKAESGKPDSITPSTTKPTENGKLTSISPAVKQSTGVALQWAGPNAIRVNKPNEFTLNVHNTTEQPAIGVMVQIRVPDGVTASEMTPEAKTEKGVLYWEIGTLAAHQSQEIKLKLNAVQKRDLTCQAWVTATGTAGVKVAVREPKLEVQIDAPKEVVLGDQFAVKYSVKNSGDDSIEKPLAKLMGEVENESKEVAVGPMLNVGASKSGEQNFVGSKPGLRKYEIVAEGEGGLKAKAVATVKVLVPKLTVAVTGPAERQVGRKATYTVTVTNGGEVPLKDVKVKELFPNEFRFVSSNIDHTLDNGSISWNVGDLIPGQDKIFTYEGLAICPGPANHMVKAVGSRNTNAEATTKTMVAGIPAMRMEVVDAVDPVEKGGETSYEIKLTNTGTTADKNVVLECVLPAEFAFVSAEGPTKFASKKEEGQTIVKFEAVETLDPKAEKIFKVKVKAVGSGDIRFKALLTSQNLTKPVSKEESTRVYGEQ